MNHMLTQIFSTFLLLILVTIIGCSKTVSVEKETAKDFTLNSLDGKRISLSDYRDKRPVLVVFWATWCPYCVEEIPALNKICDEYKNKVEVLGINIQESPEKVSGFSQKKGIKYTILVDSNGEVAKKYGVLGIPTNVLVDKNGEILYKGHSIEEVMRKLQEVT